MVYLMLYVLKTIDWTYVEVSFNIIAGKFNSSKGGNFPVKELISKDEFENEYAQDCTDLLDEQTILNIIDKIESGVTEGVERTQPRKDVGFNGFVVEDIVTRGYKFYIGIDNTVYVNCILNIEFDIFAEENHKLTALMLWSMLHKAIECAIVKSEIADAVAHFDM